MTLNDLEPHNGRHVALFYRILQLYRPITSIWLKLDPCCLRRKCRTKNVVFGSIWFTTADVRFFPNFSRKLIHPMFSLFELRNIARPSQQHLSFLFRKGVNRSVKLKNACKMVQSQAIWALKIRGTFGKFWDNSWLGSQASCPPTPGVYTCNDSRHCWIHIHCHIPAWCSNA